MPFDRPTFLQLVDRALADIEAELPGADSRLPVSDLAVLAKVLSAALHDLYGYLDWVAVQIHPDTAEAEMLDRHAAWWGISRKPAVPAAGGVTMTRIGTGLVVVPAGTLLQWNGQDYVTQAELQLNTATGSVQITASAAGVAGNAPAGAKLKLAAPVAGLMGQAVAEQGLSGGADTEDDDGLLARLLRRMQEPPHGGAKADYVTWALQVPGVTRVWVQVVEDEPGHLRVVVRFVMDGKPDTIIPTADEVASVATHMDLMRPVTAEVMVAAPEPVPLHMTIAGLDPSTQAVKDAINGAVRDLLAREAVPGGTILLSHIREAISGAAGEIDHQLIAPVADVAHAAHQIAVPGVVTWG